MNKNFARLKGKTQLFSVQADSNNHSRNEHSLQVYVISLTIANKLKSNFDLDIQAIEQASLLHDIGHTPFGHAGERTLHEILSGRDDCYGEVTEIKALGIEQGFKHNINSGLLYKSAKDYLGMNEKVMDGIIKHTKIFYDKNEEDKDLDYGFRNVVNNFRNLKNSDYYNNNPKYIEGYIVSIADEIAQVGSDYLDLLSYDEHFHDEIAKSKLYHLLENNSSSFSKMNYRNQANEFTTKLVELFVEEMKKVKNGFMIDKNSEFMLILNDIKQIENTYIKNNYDIRIFDKSAKDTIRILFSYYYVKPMKLHKSFFNNFCDTILHTKGLSKETYIRIKKINKLKITNDRNKIDNYKKEIISFVIECKQNINNLRLSKYLKKSYKLVYKLYIRFIAVHISKMTDNYAEAKRYEVINSKKAVNY